MLADELCNVVCGVAIARLLATPSPTEDCVNQTEDIVYDEKAK